MPNLQTSDLHPRITNLKINRKNKKASYVADIYNANFRSPAINCGSKNLSLG